MTIILNEQAKNKTTIIIHQVAVPYDGKVAWAEIDPISIPEGEMRQVIMSFENVNGEIRIT